MLRREVAFLAHHAHWSYETVMTMEHRERQQWVREIAALVAGTATGEEVC